MNITIQNPARNLVTVFFGAMLCASVFCAEEEFAEIQKKIVSFQLGNGVTVLLYPRGDAPVISCVTYVKTGSTDEHVGITGIAHQLEHLAFKGTSHIGTKDFAAEEKVFDDLDKLYDDIQAFEQKLPADSRDALLTLLAGATSTGGGPAAAAKLEKAVKGMTDGWQKDGIALKDEDKETLGKLVRAYAEKVREAEQYVIQNQYADVIDRNGGVGLNAFTSDDRTVYHVSLPANKLELWAALESDRFMNIVPRQLEKEKQVVLEERRMRTDSSAFGKLYENFLGVAYEAHPYGISVIGHRSDILGYTRKKIMKFYREHYTPQNTIVAVVGDIDVEQARRILTDYFGRIPPAPNGEKLVTVEPAQEGEKRVDVEFPAQPLLLLGYHVPERNHPDTPALVVLDEIATAGQTSRLYTAMVKTKKAGSVGSWIGPGNRYPRLFFFSAEPSEGQNIDELETGVLQEIEKLKSEPPTADEMKRVITRYRARVLRGLKSNLGLAEELADYQAIGGDCRELFREIKLIEAVTPKQVSDAAAKYFTRQNLTVGRIISANGDSSDVPSVLGVPVKEDK